MNNPETVRLSVFLSVFFLCAVWEMVAPRKPLTQSKSIRWLNNLGIVGFNGLFIALLSPIVATDSALFAQQSGLGLFNLVTLPFPIIVIISVLLLDFAIYLQHLLFHRIKWLWRLHRMHHADQDIDVTTGARFHPIEIMLSLGIKIAVVFVFGVPPIAVILFEVILNASAMFNHSNAKLPLGLDRRLRLFIVTPDMHRVHHSILPNETHSNFGFFLSIWDRWLNTYIAQPKQGHDKVEIGLPLFRSSREQWLDKMFTQPFREK